MKQLGAVIALMVTVITGGILIDAPSTAAMARFSSSDSTYIKKNEVVDGSAYVAGDSVTIEGVIKGDLYCAGKNVRVEAQVDGDIVCAGQNVEIIGKSGGDMRLAGEKVVLRGESAGSVSVFADLFLTEGSTKIAKDLNGGVRSAHLAGNVGRDIALGAGDLTIVGMVGRDVEGEYNNLKLAAGGVIGGNLSFSSHRDAQVEGKVNGKISRTESKSQRADNSWVSVALTILTVFVGLLLVSLFLAMAIPRPLEKATEHAVRKPLRAVMWGLGIFALLPLTTVFLMVSGVGIPVGLTLLTAWVLLLLLSGPFVGYLIGASLLKKTRSVPLRALLGGIILVTLYMIPLLNIFVMMCVMVFGVGMILSYLESEKVFQRAK